MRESLSHSTGRARFVSHWVAVNLMVLFALGIATAVLLGLVTPSLLPERFTYLLAMPLAALAWPLAQYFGVSSYLPALSRNAWILPSAGVSLGISALRHIMISAGFVAPFGLLGFGYDIAFGVAHGAAVGAVQAHVLRRHVGRTHLWIAAMAAGRGVADACWYLSAEHGLSWWTAIGFAGLFADLLLTGYVLAHLLRPRRMPAA